MKNFFYKLFIIIHSLIVDKMLIGQYGSEVMVRHINLSLNNNLLDCLSSSAQCSPEEISSLRFHFVHAVESGSHGGVVQGLVWLQALLSARLAAEVVGH